MDIWTIVIGSVVFHVTGEIVCLVQRYREAIQTRRVTAKTMKLLSDKLAEIEKLESLKRVK